jgi:hypothetical protein
MIATRGAPLQKRRNKGKEKIVALADLFAASAPVCV